MRKWLLVLGLALLVNIVWLSTTVAAAGPPVEPAKDGFWHHVSYGETLSSIGARYGVNAYSICYANNLANCNYIFAGQRLYIPGHSGYYAPTPGYGYGCQVTHHVTFGQTLSGIAAYYGVDVWTLGARNNIYNLNRLYAGTTLCIR